MGPLSLSQGAQGFVFCHETSVVHMANGVAGQLVLGFWVLGRGGERMENCKAAWQFVNQAGRSEGFHLANCVSLVCYFVLVTGVFNFLKSLFS